MTHITVEVGANIGSDTSRFAAMGLVYAIEPEPNLFKGLVAQFENNPNVKLFDYAIDLTEGEKQFYSSNLESGIGSLYDLHPDLLKSGAGIYECYKQGFHNKFTVKCIRMDSFIEQQKIEYIDYLWCDAQGNDFNVLKSFGDKLTIVKQGRCECVNEVPLYKNIDNHYKDVSLFLRQQGFNVKEDFWHAHGTEVDLVFWR